MKPLDIALAGACGAQIAAAGALAAYILRPQWFARLVSDSFLMKHSLWDECDGEPMNVWAEEMVRRDEVAAAARAVGAAGKDGASDA